ncbi:MAG: outer membrane lipoprotein carrier protein LolA [Bacillaceae bacterium]|nr:outer membrane lipoprotein carrier protein LolA [Bacillaceae bacterium]
MNKKYVLFVLVCMLVVLAACGDKSKEDVIESLEKKTEEMSGYKAQAKMNLQTGEKVQTYNITIWHKKKDMYRVHLENPDDEKSSQVILRNSDGVFVLTPALGKSFKFQSDWPHNSSQPYLYTSLINDLLKDSESQFTATDNYYMFKAKTNYQSNKNLPYQEIYFDKKSLKPMMVKVFDKDYNALVEVNFTQFDFNPEFAEDDFDTGKNLTSSLISLPAMASGEETPFTVYYPMYKPEGTSLAEQKEVAFDGGERAILTFEGNKSFTLIEEKYTDLPTSLAVPVSVNGEPVDLGFTIGALTDSSLEWTYNGMRFYLASEDLTREEMVEVAKSVQGTAIK